MRSLRSIVRWRARHYVHISVWISSVFVGLASVFYSKLVDYVQSFYLQTFHQHPYMLTAITPVFFLLAAALVQKFAPSAKGSGIPQVLEAIDYGSDIRGRHKAWSSDLVSIKTAVVKVISTVFAILGGAAIGREGPTVQIAASIFAWMGRVTRKIAPKVNFQTYLISGAAAGVAAAFNTPLAGITFAIEEIAVGTFATFRETTMIAVILSGISARALLGDYLYFGHPLVEKIGWNVLPEALVLGVIGGTSGGLFASLLSSRLFIRLPKHWGKRAFFCGVLCAIIALLTHGDSTGSGYQVTKEALDAENLENTRLLLPLWRFLTTVLSYLSGMAGGIFSPCLSIGASIGISFAKLGHLANFKVCALIGMVAFFTGAVQAPLTAVVIVTEMTDEHVLILPFMTAAFLAYAISKEIMPKPLYHYLAERHILD